MFRSLNIMEKDEFEKIVQQGISLIPEKFRRLMENVDIVIEDYPNQEQLRKTHLSGNQTLFGLYEGVPKTNRGTNYANVLPDKITIFQKPIENFSPDFRAMEKLVADTIWHEIAHHFGLSEKEIRQRNV